MVENNTNLRETHIIGEQTREYIVGESARPVLERHQIVLTGISYARKPFAFVRHHPAISQVLVSLEGMGEVLLDGEWRHCKAGQAYITPASVLHAYRACTDEIWKVCWVIYNDERRALPHISLERPTLLALEAPELAIAIDGLYHESLGQAESTLLAHWAHLVDVYAQRVIGQPSEDRRLFSLWKQVDASLAYPWNNQELAALAGMSSEHLRRLCQQEYGCSPMRHLTALRMQRAMALLISESANIEAIALRVGYENPFAFSTAFKHYTGLAPVMYRKQQSLAGGAQSAPKQSLS
jgi:AraC-like DNA-binding protein/quercetin dioxygenase-like cupin family protein